MLRCTVSIRIVLHIVSCQVYKDSVDKCSGVYKGRRLFETSLGQFC